MKVIIVGGVAGGATAAARIRRLNESAEITVFERSGYVSYANCGLPYYVGGVIEEEAELTLQSPEGFRQRFRVDVRVRHEVTAVDPAAKTVTVKNLNTGEVFTESYDRLLLAPGAKPTLPKAPGLDTPNLFCLRTVEDTLALRRHIEERKPRSAVLAGGGFIGLELAENLRKAGLDVTIVQRPDQLLKPLDIDMAAFLHAHVRQKGVKLLLGAAVEGFEPHDGGVRVHVKGRPAVDADLAVIALGVTPDTAFLESSGIERDARGSILVNERMETSAPHVYAVGDAVKVRHKVSGQPTVMALAGPANRQGRIAADNICGGSSAYQGAQGSLIVKAFDMTAAATGLNERTARELGYDVDKVFLSPPSHAMYYPGGTVMTIKVVFEKGTFRLLGAQIVGYEGVDKRIDVLATAIQAGLKGPELVDLELAYAPPYSSAKDPVNMAGYLMENMAKGRLKQFFWHDLDALAGDDSVTLLDTRTVGEYTRGHAVGFDLNIPVDELRQRIDELPKGKPVYVMCQSGIRSYIACQILSQNGFDAYNFAGGYRFYATVVQDQAAKAKALPCGMEE